MLSWHTIVKSQFKVWRNEAGRKRERESESETKRVPCPAWLLEVWRVSGTRA